MKSGTPSDRFRSFSKSLVLCIRTGLAWRDAREWRSVPSQETPSRPPKATTFPQSVPLLTASSDWGEGWAGKATGHFCSSQSPLLAGSGPLPLKGASPAMRERMVVCPIPEAGLGGPRSSKRPAFVFLSKVKKK